MSDTGLDPNMLIAAFVVGLPATIAAYGSLGAKREAAGANRAVNHKTEGQPSIAEQVDRIDQWTKAFAHDVTEIRADLNDTRRVMNVARAEVADLGSRLNRHLAHPEEDK